MTTKRKVIAMQLVATGKGPILARRADGSNDYARGEPISVADVTRLGAVKIAQLKEHRFLAEHAVEIET